MQGTWVQSLIQKIPHAVQQLSPCALTTEPYSRTREPRLLKPRLLEPMLCDNRSPHSRKPVHCSQKAAPTHSKESEACAQQRPSTARLHANMHTLLLKKHQIASEYLKISVICTHNPVHLFQHESAGRYLLSEDHLFWILSRTQGGYSFWI